MDQLPPGIDLYTIPFEPAPDGYVSDFNKPSELWGVTIAITAVFLGVQLLFLFLRIYTRLDRKEKWGWDDLCVLATTCFSIALGVELLVICKPLGRHTWDISVGFLLKPWSQKIKACELLLVGGSIFLGKLCLLTMYYRIFGHISTVKWQIWGTGFLCVPTLALSVTGMVLQSPPPGHPWGPSNPAHAAAVYTALAGGVISLAVDLLILYIPIPQIMRLNLDTGRKRGVLALFLTGAIAVIADIISLYYRVELYKAKDMLRSGFVVALCAQVEASISVICSSMPLAAKFWKVHIESSKIFVSLRSRFGSQSGSTQGSSGAPSWISRNNSPKKKRDPYSIGMNTTNLSATHLSNAGHLELNSMSDHPHGKPSFVVSNASCASSEQDREGVQREMSFEQENKPRTRHDMV